jgi:effector-binding domain-containing protein
MKRALKQIGIDPPPPFEFHVRFAQDKIADVNAARYAARKLRISVPVDREVEEIPPFTSRRSPEFRCLSFVYRGSPLDSGEQWEKLYAEAKTRNLTSSGENREIELDRKGYNAANYVTELQLGIK